MGDDERFDYLYKFVSDEALPAAATARHNLTLLESGTLYVAKLTGDSPPAEIDGTGKLPVRRRCSTAPAQWIKLVVRRPVVRARHDRGRGAHLHPAGRRRGRGDQDGPARGRPAQPAHRQDLRGDDQQHQPGRGHATRAWTRPTRGVANRHGQIFELVEDGGDHTGETFTWSLPIVCGDPADPSTYFAGYDKSTVSPISCPDNVAFDSAGNLWISTDGNALGSNDGLFATADRGRRDAATSSSS